MTATALRDATERARKKYELEAPYNRRRYARDGVRLFIGHRGDLAVLPLDARRTIPVTPGYFPARHDPVDVAIDNALEFIRIAPQRFDAWFWSNAGARRVTVGAFAAVVILGTIAIAHSLLAFAGR